ncbi:MAG: SGNH/GDSL hydrolase family protein [Microcoleaceae cyanobacterium]
MKPLKIWAINISLMLSSLMIGIGLGEVGLRVAKVEGLPKKLQQHSEFSPAFYMISDSERGWQNLPNAEGWQRQEGESYININSAGLRDRNYTKIKPKNTFRIAVLGDSFTFAAQVPMAENYTSILEEKLATCKAFEGQTVEVINFGVEGYGTAQELLTLRQQVWDYQPDLVLMAFYLGNDVIDNSKALERNHYRPFFVYQDGELVPDYSFRDLGLEYSDRYFITVADRFPAWLVNRSRILQVAKKAELEAKKRQAIHHFNTVTAQNFQSPQTKKWQEAWQITDDLIIKMSKEVKQKNSDFLLVLIADPIQVHPDEVERETYRLALDVKDFDYPDKRLQQLSESQDFPVLSLTQPFINFGKENQVCLHGFENSGLCTGHWNDKGHEFAAELINQKLCNIYTQQ